MTLKNEQISIAKKKTKISNDGSEEIEVTSDNKNIQVSVDGNKITLKDKKKEVTTANVTVKKGSYSKECSVYVIEKPTDSSEEVENTTFSTEYGKADIIWLDTSNNVIKTPNAPILTADNQESLTPVKWNSSNDIITTDKNDSSWYNYSTNIWANARTTNESYFVWIPRYAYRIIYYSDSTYKKETGYYDGYGQWSAFTGEVRSKIDEGIKTLEYNNEKYIIHPAFETDLENGGWNSELAGFWAAKYEAYGVNGKLLKITNGVKSQRMQLIGTQYTSARQATYGYTGQKDEDDGNTSFMNSHMMKNSEWGAIEYLTQSRYGRDGEKVEVNNDASYTGGGEGDAYIENVAQSTTGNVYGIYDLAGGAWELTSAYNSIDNINYFTRIRLDSSNRINCKFSKHKICY